MRARFGSRQFTAELKVKAAAAAVAVLFSRTPAAAALGRRSEETLRTASHGDGRPWCEHKIDSHMRWHALGRALLCRG